MSNIQLVLRVPLDCAYLMRSHLTWHQKVRILLEYPRLTAMVIVPGLASRRNTDRMLGYRVTHFGIGTCSFFSGRFSSGANMSSALRSGGR